MNKVSKIGKGESYSWRPGAKLKRELEAAAKAEGPASTPFWNARFGNG